MGLFIEIEIDDEKFADHVARQQVVAACPVDIFALAESRLVAVAEREDECILCGLCMQAAPASGVSVRRLYGAYRALEQAGA